VGSVRLSDRDRAGSAAGSRADSGASGRGESERNDDDGGATRSKRLFFRIRVAILLTILVGVILYAWGDARSRAARNDWSRTLDVGIILVNTGPSGSLDAELVEALRERARALGDRLDGQLHRYREGSPPFAFEVFALDAEGERAPAPPEDEGVVAALRYAWDLRRFTHSLDERSGTADRRFDSRIYLLASPVVNERRKTVEGLSQDGGRIGVVEVELDRTMLDFALFVVAHELFHTLGAPDQYGVDGHPKVPDGLADPDRLPRYPQDGAELMARHRATSEHQSVPPESLDELTVGATTARAIGWQR